jgi:hypothetical protein
MQDELPEIEIRKATIRLGERSTYIYFLYQTEITQGEDADSEEEIL